MAINLPDLRAAVANYLNTRVTCTVGYLAPAVPAALSPNERFTFSIQVSNSAAPNGIALKNVRYHVRLANPNIGRLIVPDASIAVAYPTPNTHSQIPGRAPIPVGNEVTEYYLVTRRNPDAATLGVGETDTVPSLPGRALRLGQLEIRVSAVADPDLDYLFPKDEDSRENSRIIQVV